MCTLLIVVGRLGDFPRRPLKDCRPPGRPRSEGSLAIKVERLHPHHVHRFPISRGWAEPR